MICIWFFRHMTRIEINVYDWGAIGALTGSKWWTRTCLLQFWTMLPKSGGAMHRDAVVLVNDDPGEGKNYILQSCSTSDWAEVFDVKLKLCCRLRAEAQIIWRSNGNSCGHVSKIQVHTAGDLGTRIVDALRLFPTYSYLCFSYMILNVSDHIRESNKFVTHKFQCKILLV